MKKLLVLLALCMVLSIVMVACDTPVDTDTETTAGETTEAPTNAETEAPSETESQTETDAATTETETETDTQAPDTTTEEETTTQKPVDPVKVGMSFDECDAWINGENVGAFFTPGVSASWDKIANVEDYNVQAIRVWGWVAFFAETPGTFGYQIGDADPVFDAAFSVEAEQPVIDAALSQGGKSAARMKIFVPVEYLSGEEITVKALAMDVNGTVETLVEFKLTKPTNPNAPVFFVTAGEMASSIPGSPDVASATMSADGEYITITTGTVGDPYYQLPMINGKGYQAGFIAIKYRTTVEIGGQIFIGSGAGPNGQGDNPTFDYVSDGKWNLVIVPLEGVASITDAGINYLRWDMFQRGENNSIDMAYIAAFNSAEAAIAYDALVSGNLIDTLNVPTSDWVISGHRPALQDSTDGMVAAGGVEFGALLHQGSIYVGDLNLAEMSQVVVYFGVDGSQTTIDRYDANPANRIILSKVDTNGNNSPAEEDIIASITYTELGWAVHPVTIDLTGVNYNGPVYVTYDTLPGTFMLFSSVEFTYDKNYVAPIQPENGSAELPLTVSQTLAAVAGLESGAATDVVYYTTGVVTAIGQGGSYYKNVYFTDGENEMLIYTLNPSEGMAELQVGDTITICGYIKNYNGTIEFASKNTDDGQVYVYIIDHKAAPVEEAPVYTGNWHASVDSFMYCVNDDFSDVVDFTAAATNNYNKTTITNATGTLTSVNAKYVYFANGWLAVDGYALENYVCNIYAADGSLLKTIALNLREAESGVVDHVANNMKYGEATVSNRVGQNDTEIISLAEFAGQTVTVAYAVDAANSDYTITLIELEVIVP